MLELLKVLIWPGAVVVCVIFVCIFFRKHVAALLDRTTSLGRDGLKTSPPTGQATQEIDKVNQARELVDELTSPVIREQEDQIYKILKDKGLAENSDAVKVLVRYLATTQLIVKFEELYRIVYGSQIYLLKASNENRPGGLLKGFVENHFSQVQKVHAPAFDDWNADSYVKFLLSSNLLLKDGDFYKITILGVTFLEWITRVGAPEHKGL